MENEGCLGGLVGEASAFGSGQDPGILGSSPPSSSLLKGESASPSAYGENFPINESPERKAVSRPAGMRLDSRSTAQGVYGQAGGTK